MSKLQQPTATTEELVEDKLLPPPCEPHYLTEDALVLRKLYNDKYSQRDLIPPPTPSSNYELQLPTIHSFPESLPSIDDLIIPYVRENGVKYCIEYFGEYFGCVDYKLNLLQFWFLDIVTDCVWMAQDDFQLPENLQKVVLSWVLYFIELIRDPNKNITRKEFFETFKEAILVASEIVEEGCDELPTPDKLIALIEQEEEGERSWDTCSSSSSNCSSIEITKEDYETTNFIEVGVEKRRKYLLNESTWNYDKHELSSTDSFAESDITVPPPETPKKKKRRLKDVDFYQPDPNMPSRFLPLLEESELEEEQGEGEEEKDSCMCKLEPEYIIENPQDGDDGGFVRELAETFYVNPSPPILTDETESTKEENLQILVDEPVNKSKKQILKELAIQKMWEQRYLDMDDPEKGWIPTREERGPDPEPPVEVVDTINELEGEEGEAVVEEESLSSEESETSIDSLWIDTILNQQKEFTEDNEDRQVINYGVIRAIIDFIFKYFYESFQFMVVKLAFLGAPNTICQKVNKEWKIPKRIKQELVKPKDPKPEKKKEPKPAKEKPKKEKPAKAPKPPKEKKEKPAKPAKPTAEEKAELERLKKEQQLLQEELMRQEENKRLLFPLDGAATDELFTGIFENWKRVEFQSKGKKK